MYLQTEISSETGVKFEHCDTMNSLAEINNCNAGNVGRFCHVIEIFHFFIVYNFFSIYLTIHAG